MQTVTVGFSKPNKWKPFAALIMWGYNIPYDHVYIKFHSSFYDRNVIYQASGTMVNFMSPTVFDSANEIVKEFTLEITDQNMIKMVQFAMDNAGKPYGIKQCFGLAIVRIAEIFGKSIPNPFKADGSTYVCVQLVEDIVNEFTSVKIEQPSNTITPKSMYDDLSLINPTNQVV
jgi:hypothetical protein